MKFLKAFLVLLMALAVAMPAMAQQAPAADKPADKPAETTSQPTVAKLTLGENKWIDLHYLLQFQGSSAYSYGAAGESKGEGIWTKDFSIRRSRIVMNGQAAKNVTFFTETDVFSSTTETSRKNVVLLQDAHISYKFADELMIDAGKILLPFTHHNRQSAATLMALDYALKYVGLALNSGNSYDAWRDYGFELRGLILNTPFTNKKGLIDYRIGIFDGSSRNTTSGLNRQDYPRLTGRIQINLFDPEDGFFYSDNYLGKKKVVSFGGGIDYQTRGYKNGDNIKNYLAWTADVTVDFPVADGMVAACQAGFLKVKNNQGLIASGYEGGYSYFVQAGFLVLNSIQPVIRYTLLTKDQTVGLTKQQTEAYITPGLNYYISGNNANVKFEYQAPLGKHFRDQSGEKKFTIQCQLFI